MTSSDFMTQPKTKLNPRNLIMNMNIQYICTANLFSGNLKLFPQR